MIFLFIPLMGFLNFSAAHLRMEMPFSEKLRK